MPELPEVETICRGLSSTVVDKKIKTVQIKNTDLRVKINQADITNLTGMTVRSIYRRAKWPSLVFDTGYLWLHLGMTGQLIYTSKPVPSERHIHVVLEFEDGTYLYYRDPRKFGAILWTTTNIPPTKTLGIEPLSQNLTIATIKPLLATKKKDIKTVLLDGNIIAGIGNIYASEILFASKINPYLSAKKLSDDQIKELIKHIQLILEQAIQLGGSSISDYRSISGTEGNAQSMHQVYNKTICPTCQNRLNADLQNGRTTYWCNICQQN